MTKIAQTGVHTEVPGEGVAEEGTPATATRVSVDAQSRKAATQTASTAGMSINQSAKPLTRAR